MKLRTMYLGVLGTAALIGAAAAVSALLETHPSEVANNSASGVAANSTGTIVLHPGTTGCLTRTFDNRTGQILESSTPCQTETAVDAKGVPIPLGTARTMNSISKSFK